MTIFSEVLLRLKGIQPRTYVNRDANYIRVFDEDPVLGWKNKEGYYVIPPYAETGENIHMTILSGGRRFTGTKKTTSRSKIVVLGGSFTQGWAISDNETYPWKLQQIFPSLEVMNCGTGGFGTYQSLLVLEKELPTIESPVIVLYGFITHHENRNVASADWYELLQKNLSKPDIAIPYVTINDYSVIIRHPPEGNITLPFRTLLATIVFIEQIYMRAITWDRTAKRILITESILIEMNELSKAHNAKFAVVLLEASEETHKHYISFLKTNNIMVIDCIHPFTREMRVPGEGHPNGKMNSTWSECIAEALRDQLGLR